MNPIAAARAVIRGAQVAAQAREWPELAELLGEALSMIDEGLSTSSRARVAAKARWDKPHAKPDALVPVSHAPLSLSLFDQDQRESSQTSEGEADRLPGARTANSVPGVSPAGAPKSRQFSLPDAIPPPLLTIAGEHRLADPQQSYGVYRIRRNGTGSVQDWIAWCLRERNRAPPQSETRIRIDHAEREREQYAEHQRLRREAAPPPQTFRDVLQRLAKGRPPDHADSPPRRTAQGD